ncbi:lipid-A-disaccharide synthase [Bosea sp. (in: a-proteobacteria)]|uniref:lipid-A-disaccharide synthase n=1 Tax=Bosea sp. (in: a-proteobacteria) TaxID=1871050 RepID=UPI0027366020|nr:lipid-A-disaccharide synthase [Bosea sp. (in: a-proteobacteria)]MDP3254994.1 lipid-A-disaccharide synthase [Bosea sp. (in: a-proteobacteria)]
MNEPFRLAIVAGEASGDALALRFLETLRRRLAPREVIVTGVGGEALVAAGLAPLFPQADIAVMGFGPVVARLPLLLRRMEDAARGIARFAPDLLLTIDAPDFSLRVAKKVRARTPDIPIAHWVCPSVWAWRSGRARRMTPHIDRILALLPFEPAALERLQGPRTVYVGHPLIERLDELRPAPAEAPRRADVASPLVLVLPGSRRSEIRHLMPVFGAAVARIAERLPGARFVLPAVPHLKDEIAQATAGWTRPPEIVLGEAEKLAAFRGARAALAASGTVTLELALAQVPTVAAYRGAGWEAAIARRLIKLPSVILPNLILGRSVVPEFIQEDATAQALAGQLEEALAEGEGRARQLAGFAEVEMIMRSAGESPAANAVEAALALVSSRAGGAGGA